MGEASGARRIRSFPAEPKARPGRAPSCSFVTSGGQRCPGQARATGLCSLHDPNAPRGPELKQELEQWAREGKPLQGLQLAYADLRDIDLKNHGSTCGFDLRGSDFYRAKLCGARMFHNDLRGCSFMRADLRAADLNRTDLRDVNFLGARMEWARIAGVRWGEHNLQEQQARQAVARGETYHAVEHYDRAQEVYRCLRIACEAQGHHEQAAHFRYREFTVRRLSMRPWTLKWWRSLLFSAVCGYGERPERVVVTALLIVLGFACGFATLGVQVGEQVHRLALQASLSENLGVLRRALVLSVMTFTTRGDPGMSLVAGGRLWLAAEAFAGAFSIALFVLVLIRRASR